MRFNLGLVALTILPALLTGCGGVITTAAPPPQDLTTGTGNWLISGFYQVGAGVSPYSFGGSLVNDNGQVSGIFHIDQPCFGSGDTDVPYTGIVDAKNNLSITSVPVNGQTLTFAGVLSADGSAITNGGFKITGGCTGNLASLTAPDGPGASWQTTAIHLPSLTGSWPSSLPETTGLGLTGQFTQSSTPDAHGDYAMSGVVTVTGSSCFTQGTVQAGSFVSGDSGQLIIKMNDGSILQAGLSVSYNGQVSSSILGLNLYPGSVTGGACNLKWE